jgi:hypothetical protein
MACAALWMLCCCVLCMLLCDVLQCGTQEMLSGDAWLGAHRCLRQRLCLAQHLLFVCILSGLWNVVSVAYHFFT